MQATQDFDMSKLLNSLRVSDDHQAFAHGQLRAAASKAIRDFGYEWASIPPGLKVEESAHLIQLRSRIKKTVFQSTTGWHSNQSVVWRRFSDYVKKVGARHEALKLIAKIREQISQ
ncbi:hypothetical protein G6646_02035 [Polynucleobacter paneuropaeus]|jgi:hypothetical protein|uniref:hypothetical protein n=1 Tax=Polynucleobacter paneuropaeus TaxID=2527775 RepID=UPI000DBF1171|nr:hypothetical protein [Polynucleobacter paneuropaeus]AWW47832.1 hypothetical protein DPM17_03690 [Polynucleobacter paneuropaeus]MBT8579721.1 hypothetical protein [Polynucleobacter paneuropaeus]